MSTDFADIDLETPTREGLAERYRAIGVLLDDGKRYAQRHAVAAWEELRRELESWQALVDVRFQQDTGDAAAKAAQDYADALKPVVTALDTDLKRRLLADEDRAGLERLVGSHALRLWQADLATFDPAIADDLAEESRLCAAYTEVLATARLDIGGHTVNLNGLAPYQQHPDRTIRHAAEQARWDFFAANGSRLDAIFDALVRLRHGMARKLGHATFTPLGYLRMRRVDYGPDSVAAYRDQIVTHVVPLLSDLLARRQAAFGWDRVMAWDESMIDPLGNPVPHAGPAALLDRAGPLFAALDPKLGALYARMFAGGFLDLENRPTKAGGGFCNGLPTHGMPFIFGSFAGTHEDVSLLTHEMGHAFQYWSSLGQPCLDYLWPTAELAEVHSMGLEFLSHPAMELLFGDAAERFRRLHLADALAFLPYGAAIDHFQHLVYASPAASAAERHAMWREVERRYLPWKDWGDLAYPAMGGQWQAKLHVYRLPFYYIDYALAQCCALQLWTKAQGDRAGTLAAYVELCGRGGSLPFDAAIRSAGLVSPFGDGALAAVVAAARAVLIPAEGQT